MIRNNSLFKMWASSTIAEFKITNQNEKPQSYKTYYLDRYYEILLTHLICNVNQMGQKKTSSTSWGLDFKR